LIQARGLTRSFGGRTVVSDVSFSVEPGEIVGFLGPNGAGKTTTIRMLLGLLRPQSGDASRPERVGYLPELFTAYDALTVRGYLGLMARLKGAGDDHVERSAAAAGVSGLARRPFGRLSRGQRQRVGLAQALIGPPDALLLDEPTAGLDPRQIAETREVIRQVGESAAVLFSTHQLAEAAAVCDRVLVIVAGRVVASEAVSDYQDLERRFLALVAEAETPP
jgi:ABC-2 type transport system ATP-binding protein